MLCAMFAACSDDDNPGGGPGTGETGTLPDWYYTGGLLGTSTLTTTSNAYEQPTEAVMQAVPKGRSIPTK